MNYTLNLLSVDCDIDTRSIVNGNIIENLFDQDLDADKEKLKPKLAEKMANGCWNTLAG